MAGSWLLPWQPLIADRTSKSTRETKDGMRRRSESTTIADPHRPGDSAGKYW